MDGISSYVLAIVGAVLTSLLVELFLPDGEMGKYVRMVMGFVTAIIILSPLPNVLTGEWSFSAASEGTIEIDESYVAFISELRIEAMEEQLEALLEENEIFADVKLICENETLHSVACYLRIPVINEGGENILVIEEARQMLANACGLREEKVIIYG